MGSGSHFHVVTKAIISWRLLTTWWRSRSESLGKSCIRPHWIIGSQFLCKMRLLALIFTHCAFNFTSEASYVYILSWQKFINSKRTQNCWKWQYSKNSYETFWVIFKQCDCGERKSFFFVHAISQHPFFAGTGCCCKMLCATAALRQQTYGRKSIVKELIFPSSEFSVVC